MILLELIINMIILLEFINTNQNKKIGDIGTLYLIISLKGIQVTLNIDNITQFPGENPTLETFQLLDKVLEEKKE